MDNVPHILKLSNQTLLDSMLPNRTLSSYDSVSALPLQDDDAKSNIQKDNAFPMHESSLHKSFTSYIPVSYMSDGNEFYDPGSVTTSSDEESTVDDSYSSECSTASDASDGQIGIDFLRRKKLNRRCSREQRKILMHQLYQAQQRKSTDK